MLKVEKNEKMPAEGRRSPQKPDDFFLPFFKFCVDFFPTFLTTRRFKTTLFYLRFCFVWYAVQSSSLQYKMLSPFLGGGWGVKAIPRTALLLSKTTVQSCE
jgi:hypothetical protein